MRLMLCVWLAAAGKFCWAMPGFAQAIAVSAVQIANVDLSMCPLLDLTRPHRL
jgi:hypothetical protein